MKIQETFQLEFAGISGVVRQEFPKGMPVRVCGELLDQFPKEYLNGFSENCLMNFLEMEIFLKNLQKGL